MSIRIERLIRNATYHEMCKKANRRAYFLRRRPPKWVPWLLDELGPKVNGRLFAPLDHVVPFLRNINRGWVIDIRGRMEPEEIAYLKSHGYRVYLVVKDDPESARVARRNIIG